MTRDWYRIALIVAATIAAVVGLLLCGCWSRLEYDGQYTKAEYETRDGNKGRWETRGPAADANSGNVQNFDPSGAPIEAPEGGISSAPRKVKTSGSEASGRSNLYLIGAGLIAAGIVLAWYFKQPILGVSLGASGVVVLAFAYYGAVALFGFVVVLGILVYWAWKTGRLETWAGVVAPAVEKLKQNSPGIATEVTDAIGAEAERQGVETTVRNVTDEHKP